MAIGHIAQIYENNFMEIMDTVGAEMIHYG